MLPTLQLQGLADSSLHVGQAQTLTLNVTNGTNDTFNPQSIQWQTLPDNAGSVVSISDQGCAANQTGYACTASLTAQTADNYTIAASGYGVLGGIARQYALGTLTATGGCQIGSPGPAGGIIFYCDSTGQHGLEAAPVDQTPSPWGCVRYGFGFTWTTVGGTSSAIGTGAANTAAIIAACGTSADVFGNPSTLTNAAATAAAYTLNGYSDWYLPSQDELNQLYLNYGFAGGFSYNANGLTYYGYWSSTERTDMLACDQYFDSGSQYCEVKDQWLGVRAIRAF